MPLVERHRLGRLAPAQARVVDQDVHLPERGHRLVHDRLHLFGAWRRRTVAPSTRKPRARSSATAGVSHSSRRAHSMSDGAGLREPLRHLQAESRASLPSRWRSGPSGRTAREMVGMREAYSVAGAAASIAGVRSHCISSYFVEQFARDGARPVPGRVRAGRAAGRRPPRRRGVRGHHPPGDRAPHRPLARDRRGLRDAGAARVARAACPPTTAKPRRCAAGARGATTARARGCRGAAAARRQLDRMWDGVDLRRSPKASS